MSPIPAAPPRGTLVTLTPRTLVAGLIGAAGAGLALAYWLDPSQGPRRRATLRDKARHAGRTAAGAAEASMRDMAQRGGGMVAHVRQSRDPVDDRILEQRVRTRIGRWCSHPGAVHVTARDGHVELVGPILREEAGSLLRQVRRVPGVQGVIDHMQARDTAGGVPSLQGGSGRRRQRLDVLQSRWSPATRVLCGAAGLSLTGWSRRHRGIAGPWVLGGGLLLLARSITNLPFARLLGVGAGRRAIEVRKDIFVRAPLRQVYDVFRRFETFPKFMSHVEAVAPAGDGRWRWTVRGPGGIPTTWVARVVRMEPNALIAWKSDKGASVGNAGVVRFDREGEGTRVSIRLSYNPLGTGAIGHAVAKAFGVDPKHQLDDDMLRFKSLMETGKATGHEKVSREDVVGAPRSEENEPPNRRVTH